jgi:hypothetical protein
VRDVCASERFKLRQFVLIAVGDRDVGTLFEKGKSDGAAEASGAACD